MNDKMKKPIRRFPEHSDMTPPKTYLKNTVSLCKKEKHIHFNPYQWQYLSTVALEDSCVFTLTIGSAVTTSMVSDVSYSTDKGNTWINVENVDNETVTITTPEISKGKFVLWKGNGIRYGFSGPQFYQLSYFKCEKEWEVRGNIMSLLYDNDFLNKTTLPQSNGFTFVQLFGRSDSKLTSAKHLYLPAKVLLTRCYAYMFYQCTSLTTAPELPATTLATNCYLSMFQGCTELISAPDLPVTTLANGCYYRMFCDCTRLTTAPELPATTVASTCYKEMFYGCSNLLTAPSTLPALTLYGGCYQGMFEECRSLTAAPELPATTIASSCYIDMFRFCTSLKTGPTILPALTLYSQCYRRMFRFCNNLENAPILPAPILVTYCYHHMFDGANKINHVKCLANSGFETEDCITNWLLNTSSTGTFVKAQGVEWPSGVSGIPTGWTVEEEAV